MLARVVAMGLLALFVAACSSASGPSGAAPTTKAGQQHPASSTIPSPQPYHLSNIFLVTGNDDGHTLRLRVGDTVLVRLAGSHVVGAVLYGQPLTADWHSFVPIPDPECPDIVSVERMLEQSGASVSDAQGLATAVSCQHQLFGSGEAFAAFRAVNVGTARVTAPALDPKHPPFEVSFEIVG